MESLWIETTKDKIKLESLKRDETTEVCIIGGGLFGLTTAYYLSQNGDPSRRCISGVRW